MEESDDSDSDVEGSDDGDVEESDDSDIEESNHSVKWKKVIIVMTAM